MDKDISPSSMLDNRRSGVENVTKYNVSISVLVSITVAAIVKHGGDKFEVWVVQNSLKKPSSFLHYFDIEGGYVVQYVKLQRNMDEYNSSTLEVQLEKTHCSD